MNKFEMIKEVATRTGFTQKDVKEIVETTCDVIVETVTAGDRVNIVGFGAFDVSERAARVGHNPKTGEPIDIPAIKTPKFKAGKTFKDIVKGE